MYAFVCFLTKPLRFRSMGCGAVELDVVFVFVVFCVYWSDLNAHM